jgi:hypothetical protein
LGGASRVSGVTKPPPPTTTTDDTPDLDRNKVQLDIPDDLFASTFPLLTSISQTVGDFMMVSVTKLVPYTQITRVGSHP